MAGIAKSKELVLDIKSLVLQGIAIAKAGGSTLSIIRHGVKIVAVVKEIMEDLPGALPECKELDSAELTELGTLFYTSLEEVFAALKS
jgi:hypothetical protein